MWLLAAACRDDVEAAAKPDSKSSPADQQPTTAAATTDGSGSTHADAAAAGGAAAAVLGATQLPGAVAVSRTYSYEDEATCDKHVGIFLQAIATGAKLPGQGFAAIKVGCVLGYVESNWVCVAVANVC